MNLEGTQGTSYGLNEQNDVFHYNLPDEEDSDRKLMDNKEQIDEENDLQIDDTVKESSHTNIVKSHYNSIEEKGLYVRKQSRIFHMRNFNNWVKSVLINEYLTKIRDNMKGGSALRVLDMCCGKGGDLLKWQKGKVTHLICTDIAENSIEQCEQRYNTLNNYNKFTAEFFACDATIGRLREKYRDPSIQLHLVSCQFAFHYSFESLKQAETMLRNAAECLLPGGYFIGTIPDAYEIVKRQRLSGSEKIENDIYSIKFQCDMVDIPLFGAKYDFYLEGVVNCPEFLVHFPTFVKLARKFGLELIVKERFPDFFNRNITNGRDLLEKMQALEGYSSNSHNLIGNKEDYVHVYPENFNKNFVRNVGTISLPEWEAICLYTTFVFRKGKTIWNKDGKPEYEFPK